MQLFSLECSVRKIFFTKMRLVLLFSFLWLSVAFGRSEVLPAADQRLIDDLKTLGESVLKASLESELSNRLKVAQFIINSKVAPQSVIDGMQAFITQWKLVLPRVSEEDYGKFTMEFPKAFGLEEWAKFKDKDAGLNQYTNGGFSLIKAKIERDDMERLSLYKLMAVEKMAQMSQATKQADNAMMDSFYNFVNDVHLKVRNFNAFLRALRKY